MKLWECDFGSPVSLSPIYVDGGQWWQKVENAARLPGVDKGFQLQVSDQTNDPGIYTQQHLVDYPGAQGRSLIQFVLGSEPGQPVGQARSNWFFIPNIQEHGRRWIQKSRIFLQHDLAEAMAGPPGQVWNFRQLFEVKVGSAEDPGGAFRMNCGVNWTPRGLVWVMNTGYAPFSEHDIRNWGVEQAGVIVGQWFDLEVEIEFKRQGGLFRVKIGPETIGEFRGQTSTVQAGQILAKWKLAVLYTKSGTVRHDDPRSAITKPHWQLVDRIELHSGPEGGP